MSHQLNCPQINLSIRRKARCDIRPLIMIVQGIRRLSTSPAVRSHITTKQTCYSPLIQEHVLFRGIHNNHVSICISTTRGTRSFGTLSMDLLKELRARSGAPIVDCKKALQNVSNNDLNAAMDWLREHGAAKASSKVEGRETTEGLVALGISDDCRSATLVKVASETDFAGRSAKFLELVLNVADTALEANGTVSEESILSSSRDGKTVKDRLDEAIVAIRENISVTNAVKVECEKAGMIVVGYVHNRVGQSMAGTAAAVVELAPLNDKVSVETMQSVGKKLAMHIVAARPQYLTPDSVPSDVLEREKDILMKQQEGSGKSLEILEKVVQGRLRKFYESICLVEQPHMIEDKNPKVGKHLKDQGIAVTRFEALSIS